MVATMSAMILRCFFDLAAIGFRPSGGSDVLDLPVGHRWEAGERLAQVGVRIDSMAAAALNHRVEDRTAFPGFRLPDEQSVLFAEGSWQDCVFHLVIVDLEASVFKPSFQPGQLSQGVIDGLAQGACGQIASFKFESGLLDAVAVHGLRKVCV